MVFKNSALFPQLTVYENLAFPLRVRKISKEDIDKKVDKALSMVSLSGFENRMPGQLSGGQQQRVAVARALVFDPAVVLMDEPLGALDKNLRESMQYELKHIHESLGVTVVYVTHDQVEAMTLADRIVVMNNGLIEQVGTPQEMYDSPATRFVAGFIGSPAMNFVGCNLVEVAPDKSGLRLGSAVVLPVPVNRNERYRPFLGQDMIFGIRPEHVTDQRAHSTDDQFDFESNVVVLEPTGVDTMVFIELNDSPVWARSIPISAGEVGQSMQFTVDMKHMHLVDPGTDLII